MGSIYKRGGVFWIKYYRNRKPYRESSGTTKKMVAKKLLERREGEIAQGKLPSVEFEKITFDQLAKGFLADYRINKKKSLVRAERSVNHLENEFIGLRVPSITTPRINSYIEDRIAEGAANATINRELAALKRMLNLGANQTPPIVDRVPHIPMLKENNTRKGFFEHGDFLAFRKVLPEYLKGFVTFGYKTGWRFSEIANLTWPQIDLDRGVARLESGETKNDKGRIVYLDEELQQICKQLWEARKINKKILPWVFTNCVGNDRMGDIRKSWNTACKNAKIGKMLFHDLRRTAVRNMLRAGIPERVAMMISGHKTRSIFDRYNIVSESDLKLAAQRQENYLSTQFRHNLGTIHEISEKKGLARTS
ncbi:MAG: site-specific integrase [Desulfobacteraceae bacterium]|nr:MAG: site-specific integrase [Desulfobacteraceae bacterium]